MAELSTPGQLQGAIEQLHHCHSTIHELADVVEKHKGTLV